MIIKYFNSYTFIKFNPNRVMGCICSAINYNSYSAISEYSFHIFPSNKGKV